MENEKMNSTSQCELEGDVFRKKTEEPPPCNESKLNTICQDEKDDLESNSLAENSAETFASTSGSSKTIKVYLRLKPFLSKIELTREQENAYTIINSTTLLTKFPGSFANTRSLKHLISNERVYKTFTFTRSFGSGVSQKKIFDEAIEPQIRNFLTGQNATIMSYGTSNAGKSYTLYGVPSALGIIPLSINFIFNNIKSTLSTPWYKPIYQSHVIGLSSTDRVHELEIRDKLLSFEFLEKAEFIKAYQEIRETIGDQAGDLALRNDENVMYSAWISFAEIYNDAIYDLLSSDLHKNRLPLKMVTDKQGRTFIKDLRTVYVNSDEEAYQILLAAQFRSRIAATTLNSRSSRSHCIFTVKLLKYYAESAPDDVEVTSMSFCDLAGSGRLKMTTNIRDRLKETQNINTSLLVFGRCLKSIWEGQSVRQKSEVVGPFRESKLTRLFQKALSGKEHMALIVNVNPIPSLYAETQNVLNFSAIAKKIIVEPVKEIKQQIFTSRFSRVVSQSAKTITDWDHIAVGDSTRESYLREVKILDSIPREDYEDLSAEYEKLKEEYAALKNSIIERDLEIREEMANTYTGLINNLESNWRSRTKDVEEQQNHLLAWSVSQVENFYKEKLNHLNSRKRKRWDNGDAADDREADIREMEVENASLTAKILIAKETIKELRSGRENAFADKNKVVFELSLVKEEIIGMKKMLEAAEKDIQFEKDGEHLTHELKMQLSSREERIKSLKEFLNEAKDEYIRITSDADQMQEELKEANTTLIENSEKIDELEEQLEQSNISLMQKTQDIEQLSKKLEHQTKQLAEFENRVEDAEKKLKESESIRLNLIGAVEDLNNLHKVKCSCAPQNSNYFKYSSPNFDANNLREKDMINIEGPKTVTEISDVPLEIPPSGVNFQKRNRSENMGHQEKRLEGSSGNEVHDTDGFDELVCKENQNSSKFSDLRESDDSGIAVSLIGENQTFEQNNSTVDTNLLTDIKNISGNKQLANLQFQNCMQPTCILEENIWLKKLFQGSDNAKQGTANTVDGFTNTEIRDTSYENICMPLDTEKELTTKIEEERFYYERLNEQVLKLEKQFAEANLNVQTEVKKYFNEHETKIRRLKQKLSEFKEEVNSQNGEIERKYELNTRNTSWSDEISSNGIDLLAAPTSTPRDSASHSDAKSMPIASLGRNSISSSNSISDNVEERSQMTKKKQKTDESINSQSESQEVQTTLRSQDIMLIIFLIIICLVDFV